MDVQVMAGNFNYSIPTGIYYSGTRFDVSVFTFL